MVSVACPIVADTADTTTTTTTTTIHTTVADSRGQHSSFDIYSVAWIGWQLA
ncbi:hypothetical protein ACQY0O_004754 [Thecaphora frezii]